MSFYKDATLIVSETDPLELIVGENAQLRIGSYINSNYSTGTIYNRVLKKEEILLIL